MVTRDRPVVLGVHRRRAAALMAPAGREPLDGSELDDILEQVRGSAYRIIKGKGATNFAIGLAGLRVLEVIERDEQRVLPVSGLVDGDDELGHVCLSLPRVVGRSGITHTVDIPLDDTERTGLRRSADAIRDAGRGGLGGPRLTPRPGAPCRAEAGAVSWRGVRQEPVRGHGGGVPRSPSG